MSASSLTYSNLMTEREIPAKESGRQSVAGLDGKLKTQTRTSLNTAKLFRNRVVKNNLFIIPSIGRRNCTSDTNYDSCQNFPTAPRKPSLEF